MKILQQQTDRGGTFYLPEKGDAVTEMVYTMAGPNKMIIHHTEVSEHHQGKGIGKELVAAAAEYARQNNIKILPLCTFTKAVMDGNKDYQDLLDKED